MANSRKILVIGGSAAGPKTAAKARRMDQHAEITIVQKDHDLSMASCGYPYYVGGTFDDRNQLIATPTGVVRDPIFFMNAKGIRTLINTEATAIDRDKKCVTCKNLETGEGFSLDYDKLVIATGSIPIMPPLPGFELAGILSLKSMADADYLRKVRDQGVIKNAVVVGGGLIGIETCEALNLAGINITVIEMMPQILPFLDWEIAKLLENHIKSKAANVITDNPVAEFLGKDGKLIGLKLKNGTELPCELAVIATGVRPNTKLALDAGLAIGETRGISVNEYLQTSDPDIYAAGDCIEVVNSITGKKVFAPLGDYANLQGRVIGKNLIEGNKSTYPGVIQTAVCKVFDYNAGSTGLSEASARANGFENVVAVIAAAPDKPSFMGGMLLVIKIVADADTGKVLGVQCAGPGDVSKRIAIAAMALHAGMTVEDMCNLDLPYAPPFSPAIENLVTAAHVLENKLSGRMRGISASEVKAKLDAGEEIFLLDTRGPDEFEQMRLGLGEVLIPLEALRSRLGDLPKDKKQEIICYCKISLRGYEAASLLAAHGWTNVKVLEGGIMAWPFPREK
ncbi:MAG: FAD-dependent oxidoreductase [Planctomycetes bacterium]|nr:FAD-dependent oxidoreductase [Planctomycetota bacterium]